MGSGGAERSTGEFVQYLHRAGVSPIVACLYRSSEGVQDEVVESGIDVRFLETRGPHGKINALRKLVAKTGPDLVHTAIFESDVLGRLAALGGPPVMSSLVNVSYDPVRLQDPNIKRWKLEIVRRVDAYTARALTAHFHAVSHTAANAAVSHLGVPAEQITVVERGRDARRLGTRDSARRQRVRDALGISQSAPVLISVGRQEYQKGHKYLVRALPQVLTAHPGAVLLLVGRVGSASAEIEEVARDPMIADHVTQLGFRQDVPDLLASADVFVLPSLYEGLPGAAIEAMALGLPVVASDIPPVREVVKHEATGKLVPIRSPDALASAVNSLLDAPSLRRVFGERGRVVFEDRFSSERSHQRMASLYEMVARSGRRSATKNEAVAG